MGLAALAVMAPALAQSAKPEARLVEAFRAYCIATAAQPTRFQAEIERRLGRSIEVGTDRYGDRVLITQVMASIEPGDPHRRMVASIGETPGRSGAMRLCRVEAAWSNKPDLVAALTAALPTAGTPVALLESQTEMELTRWTIEVEGVRARRRAAGANICRGAWPKSYPDRGRATQLTGERRAAGRK
jgi:hypothetical protein